MKEIEKVKAWRYPCDGKVFEFRDSTLETRVETNPIRTKKELVEDGYCDCGKKCRPERIEIVVRKCK